MNVTLIRGLRCGDESKNFTGAGSPEGMRPGAGGINNSLRKFLLKRGNTDIVRK